MSPDFARGGKQKQEIRDRDRLLLLLVRREKNRHSLSLLCAYEIQDFFSLLFDTRESLFMVSVRRGMLSLVQEIGGVSDSNQEKKKHLFFIIENKTLITSE